MKVKEMLVSARPREKLQEKGEYSLTDSELLALILRTGNPGQNVIEVATNLIKQYGLDKLNECSLEELQEIKGIGLAKACQIQALFEFNKRHNMAKQPLTKISSAEDVYNYMKEKLKDKKQEHFIVLMLDNKNKLIKEELITKGILDSSIIHPREVFRPAIKNSAKKIILVHNHPSGNPQPSEEDIEVTKRLRDAADTLGVKLLDHVIVGGEGFWSLV